MIPQRNTSRDRGVAREKFRTDKETPSWPAGLSYSLHMSLRSLCVEAQYYGKPFNRLGLVYMSSPSCTSVSPSINAKLTQGQTSGRDCSCQLRFLTSSKLPGRSVALRPVTPKSSAMRFHDHFYSLQDGPTTPTYCEALLGIMAGIGLEPPGPRDQLSIHERLQAPSELPPLSLAVSSWMLQR